MQQNDIEIKPTMEVSKQEDGKVYTSGMHF